MVTNLFLYLYARILETRGLTLVFESQGRTQDNRAYDRRIEVVTHTRWFAPFQWRMDELLVYEVDFRMGDLSDSRLCFTLREAKTIQPTSWS